MTTVKDIYNYIDAIAPFETAMDFDNVGILAGNPNAQVETVLLALDITPQVVKEAQNQNAQLIISHHPIIFKPLKALPSSSVPYLLAQADISAICAHTNLDLAEGGVNSCLASALGLLNQNLIEGKAMVIGTLPTPLKPKAFAEQVKTQLHCTGLRYTAGEKNIHTVAVSSGSGSDNIDAALSFGADALVTGEIKHSFILSAIQQGLMIVDAGHYRTEDVVIKPLIHKLGREFPKIEFKKSISFTDNVEYL